MVNFVRQMKERVHGLVVSKILWSGIIGACVIALALTPSYAGASKKVADAKTIARVENSLKYVPASPIKVVPTVHGSHIYIPLGNGRRITWTKGEKLRVAFLDDGLSNAYLTDQNNAMHKWASSLGISLTTFDANLSATTQYDQLQSVLTGGVYNTILINALDPGLVCNSLTVQAVSENILVLPIISPICYGYESSGVNQWTPGTLGYVGSDSDYATYLQFFTLMAKMAPSPINLAMVLGVQTGPPEINASAALATVMKSNPNVNLVGTYYTNWTTAAAYTATQTALVTNPNINVIFANSANLTLGVENAIASSAPNAKIEVFGKGGSTYEVGLIKSGQLIADDPQYPLSNGTAPLSLLYLVTRGITISRWLGNDGHPLNNSNPQFVTAQNVSKFKAQYGLS